MKLLLQFCSVLVINIKIITKQTWIGFCSKLITCRGYRILEVYILGSAHYHLGMCIVLCFVYLDSIKKFGKLTLRCKPSLLILFDVVISGFLWLKLRIPDFDKKKINIQINSPLKPTKIGFIFKGP